MQKRNAVCIVLVSMALAKAATGLPQESQLPAMAIVLRISETYANLKSYRFEWTINLEVAEAGRIRAVSRSGTTWVVRPNHMRTESKTEKRVLVAVTQGDNTWLYSPNENKYAKRTVTSVNTAGLPLIQATLDGDAFAGYSSLANLTTDAKLLKEESVKLGDRQVGCYVLEVKYGQRADPGDLALSRRRIWAAKNSFMVVRDEFTLRSTKAEGYGGPDTVTGSLKLKSGAMNEPVPDSLFAFTPPAGAKEVKDSELFSSGRPGTPGAMAVDFRLKDLDGKEVNLAGLKGKVVLLNFWATWCEPCREEMPGIQQLYQQYKDKDLVVLGINSEGSGIAGRFLKKFGYTFPVLYDSSGKVSQQYKVTGLPTTVILDREGRVVSHILGSRQMSVFLYEIRKAGIGQ